MMTRREFARIAAVWSAAAALPRLISAPTSTRFTTVDTHAHIFERGLRLAASRRYTPAYDATLAHYLGQLDSHGISHGVLVQPSFLGMDNSYIFGALTALPDRLRGIAVVGPGASTEELRRLSKAGFVGIRFNLDGEEIPAFRTPPWSDLLRRVVDLDWQVEVHRQACDLPRIVEPLLAAGAKVVVDHFGRPDPKLGVDDPGFRFLLGIAGSRRVWIKLSGAYRQGGVARGEEIARAAVPLLRKAFGPERLVWGSDWPHTRFEQATNYDEAVKSFNGWITDPAERELILQGTPRQLFRFA